MPLTVLAQDNDVRHELRRQMDKGKKCISVVGKRVAFGRPFCVCAPWARSNGCKSRTRPDSGKCIAEQQGCPSRGGI